MDKNKKSKDLYPKGYIVMAWIALGLALYGVGSLIADVVNLIAG